jgi:nicotinate-nucleotide adenylyltransferase
LTLISQKIGLLGGSFDPVHNAHLALAHAAYEQLNLSSVRLIPAGHAWQKQRSLTPAKHRLAMLKLALEFLGPWAEVDEIETQRSGPTYTMDTLAALEQIHGKQNWFWIMGTDQLANFCSWHRWEELTKRLTLAVAIRAKNPWQIPYSLAALKPRIKKISMPTSNVSATEIRNRILQQQPISELVPEQIAQYIANHQLYQKIKE